MNALTRWLTRRERARYQQERITTRVMSPHLTPEDADRLVAEVKARAGIAR